MNNKALGSSLNSEVIDKIRELHRPSILGTLIFVLYACLMYFGVGYLIYELLISNLNIFIKVILFPFLLFLSLGGLRLMGNLGHDGTHFTLSKNKFISVIMGCFFSSCVIGFMEMGFSVSHWYHHRFINQSSDPDVMHYSRYDKSKGFLNRLFFAFPSRLPHYWSNTIKMALGKPLTYDCKIGLNSRSIKVASFLNIIFSIFWLSSYIMISIYNPIYALVGIWIPNLVALFANGFTVFIQHGGTGKEELYASRSIVSPLTTILYFGGNFHLEHHLYPGIPMYRLPFLHALLRDNGVYNQEGINIDFAPFAELTYAWSNYPNGK